MVEIIQWTITSQLIMLTAIWADMTFPKCRAFFRIYPWPFTWAYWRVYRSFDFHFGWTPYLPSWFRLNCSFRYYPHITLSVMTRKFRVRLGKLKWHHPVYRAYGREWPV